MGKHYRHLGLEERCQVAELHQAGRSIQQIAAALDRSPSSISRELKRNRGVQVGYKPTYAQEQATARRWKGSRLERNAELRALVLDRLTRGWSPEQIAGWLARNKATARISHESIYRFIYDQIRRTNDGSWRHYLPRAKGKRGRRRRASRSSVSLIKGRVSITLRPPEVGLRTTFGHWEADLMLFTAPGQAILVSQERKSRAAVCQAARQGRPPGRGTPPQLVHRHRPAAAQVHHLRQRHRVRPASSSGRSARHPNLLLRSPQPLAKGHHRKRHRPAATLSAPQH
jgi:IS30 family transposase